MLLPLEMSMVALDLLLPLNWSVRLIIWYLRIPYKSLPYFGDYNFKKRHWFIGHIREMGGGRGRGQEVQHRQEVPGRYSWKHLFDTFSLSPQTATCNRPAPWKFSLPEIWQINIRKLEKGVGSRALFRFGCTIPCRTLVSSQVQVEERETSKWNSFFHDAVSHEI